jgi:AcrR family transcriptional regulator
MQSTKHKIIDAAIRLFNEYGMANVRLQQIADESGISVGNLAYHFKNKEAIVLAVYELLFDKFSNILSHYLQDPGLLDFDKQLEEYYDFFTNYRFLLIDLFNLELSYSSVIEQWQSLMSKMMLQVRKRLDYLVRSKIIIPEPLPGVYDTLANNIWGTTLFWLPQQMLKGMPSDVHTFKQSIWAQINPYLTTVGKAELNIKNL